MISKIRCNLCNLAHYYMDISFAPSHFKFHIKVSYFAHKVSVHKSCKKVMMIWTLLHHFLSFFFFQDGLFHCTYPGCFAKLQTKHGYEEHVNRHVGVYKFNCPYCNKGLNTEKQVKGHLKQHTRRLGLHCIHCLRQFNRFKNLMKHLDSNDCSGRE